MKGLNHFTLFISFSILCYASCLSAKVPSWSIQYNGELTEQDVDYCIFDLFNYSEKQIRKLKCTAIAYFSTQYENFRSDSDQFSPTWNWKKLDDWEGEQIFHAANLAQVEKIMFHRIDLAVHKGFKGIDMDNVDMYTQGYSQKEQIDYYNHLWNYAKSKNLLVGLKNAGDIRLKVNAPDFLMLEQCQQYKECPAGFKNVFDVEYKKRFCKKHAGIYIILKNKIKMGRERKLCQ